MGVVVAGDVSHGVVADADAMLLLLPAMDAVDAPVIVAPLRAVAGVARLPVGVIVVVTVVVVVLVVVAVVVVVVVVVVVATMDTVVFSPVAGAVVSR